MHSNIAVQFSFAVKLEFATFQSLTACKSNHELLVLVLAFCGRFHPLKNHSRGRRGGGTTVQGSTKISGRKDTCKNRGTRWRCSLNRTALATAFLNAVLLPNASLFSSRQHIICRTLSTKRHSRYEKMKSQLHTDKDGMHG